MPFVRKKSIFFAKCDEISWETDKLNVFSYQNIFRQYPTNRKNVMTGFRHGVKGRSQKAWCYSKVPRRGGGAKQAVINILKKKKEKNIQNQNKIKKDVVWLLQYQ